MNKNTGRITHDLNVGLILLYESVYRVLYIFRIFLFLLSAISRRVLHRFVYLIIVNYLYDNQLQLTTIFVRIEGSLCSLQIFFFGWKRFRAPIKTRNLFTVLSHIPPSQKYLKNEEDMMRTTSLKKKLEVRSNKRVHRGRWCCQGCILTPRQGRQQCKCL